MGTYAIRPPEWAKGSGAGGEFWYAKTPLGGLSVSKPELGRWKWHFCFDGVQGTFPCASAEDGKARAWEYFLGRLLPALEEQP